MDDKIKVGDRTFYPQESLLRALNEALPEHPPAYPFKTGVTHHYQLNVWSFQESLDDGVDLDFEEWQAANPDSDPDYFDSFESDYLIGDWQKDESGQYEPNPDGTYAAIYRGSSGNIQVVWSRWFMTCRLCSPCYPDQGDLDTPINVSPVTVIHDRYHALNAGTAQSRQWLAGGGDCVAYSLPPEYFEE